MAAVLSTEERRKSIRNAGSTRKKNSDEEQIEFDDFISDAAQYGRIQFWDFRYVNEHEPFEWYYGYGHFRETIRDVVPLDAKVMVAGCGSSNMLGDMADDGYTNVVGADWSRVVIAQLKYRYKDYPEISLFQGNMTDTDLPEGSINAIIDKALMDSLLCTQMSSVAVQQYIFEVERLLDDDGVFICISSGNPEQCLPLIEQFDLDEPNFTPWIVEVQALLKPKEFAAEIQDPTDPNCMYFIYICKKNKDLVNRKKVKLGRITQKQMNSMKPKGKRVNIKPS